MTCAQLDPSAHAPCTSTTFLAFTGAAASAVCAANDPARMPATTVSVRKIFIDLLRIRLSRLIRNFDESCSIVTAFTPTCPAPVLAKLRIRNARKKRPGFPGRFRVQPISAESLIALRGDRGVDHLRRLRAGVDRNAAGLLGLGDLAHEVDMEQVVLERGVLHLHEIGKLEDALEGTRGDAAVEHFGSVLAVLVG